MFDIIHSFRFIFNLSNGPAKKESTNGYEHVGMQKGTNFSFVYAILLIGLNSKSWENFVN